MLCVLLNNIVISTVLAVNDFQLDPDLAVKLENVVLYY
jgi:hypothetical protein